MLSRLEGKSFRGSGSSRVCEGELGLQLKAWE